MIGLMTPAFIAVVAALVLSRGSPGDMFRVRVRWWPAILAAFAVELVLYNPPIDGQAWAMQAGPWIWLATKLVVLAVFLANAWPASGILRWPWLLAAGGVGLNALVIALNGGHMPQSPEAAVAVWGTSHIDPNSLQNVAQLRADTLLPWLADVLPQPAWLPRPNVVSLGDILLAAGVAGWVFRGMAPAAPLRKAYIGRSGATAQRATPVDRRCSH